MGKIGRSRNTLTESRISRGKAGRREKKILGWQTEGRTKGNRLDDQQR